MKHIFVINPAAGTRHFKKLKAKIERIAKEKEIHYGFCIAEDVHDLPDVLRREAEAADERVRFYACGGDGTLCQVTNAMIGIPGSEVALIPAGTGNDFSRNFDNRDFFNSIERQIDGRSVLIDTITVNGIHSVNMINIGFDCDVVAKTDAIKRRSPFKGSFAYLIGVFFTFLRKYGTKMTLELPNGETVTEELMLTAIGNGGFCGGGFHSNPEAVLDDGLFDLCRIKKVSRGVFIRLISLYKKGLHLASEKAREVIAYDKLQALKMRFDKVIGICIDGDIIHADHADIAIAPQSLAFSIPDGCTPILPLVRKREPLPV